MEEQEEEKWEDWRAKRIPASSKEREARTPPRQKVKEEQDENTQRYTKASSFEIAAAYRSKI